MKSWAYLFVPANWSIDDLLPISVTEIGLPIFSLRLYCKSFSIDMTLPVLVSPQNIWPEIALHLSRPSRLFPSGVFLKPQEKPFPSDSTTYLFVKARQNQGLLWIGFSREALQALVYLLSGKPTQTKEEDALLEELSQWFHASLCRPPINFEEQILSLSDNHLQWLLQWLLSSHIVSSDMLAAYIWSLDKKGKRLLENLSINNRREISEKIGLYHRQRTYRWADEVKFLLHHNLLRHPHHLSHKIHLFEIYASLHLQQTSEDLEFFLKNAQSWHKTLSSLPPRVRSSQYTRIPMRWVSAYGSFVNEEIFLSWWQDIISNQGLRILKEDREWWRMQPFLQRSLEAMRFLKLWFSLEAETLVHPSEMPHVLLSLSSPWQIELIAHEIGVATCIYALKPLEVPSDRLPPMMSFLLEDILHGTISFSGWEDCRIPDAQKKFLIAVYVLRHIGRL